MFAWCCVVVNDEKNGRDRNNKSGHCAFCSLSLSFELVDRLKGNYGSKIEIKSMLIYFNVFAISEPTGKQNLELKICSRVQEALLYLSRLMQKWYKSIFCPFGLTPHLESITFILFCAEVA